MLFCIVAFYWSIWVFIVVDSDVYVDSIVFWRESTNDFESQIFNAVI